MLDEEEWARVSPYLSQTIAAVKDYRQRTGAGIADAKKAVSDRAC
jgi:translation elongation factor EF-Ts